MPHVCEQNERLKLPDLGIEPARTTQETVRRTWQRDQQKSNATHLSRQNLDRTTSSTSFVHSRWKLRGTCVQIVNSSWLIISLELTKVGCIQ